MTKDSDFQSFAHNNEQWRNKFKNPQQPDSDIRAIHLFLLGEQPLDGYWFNDYRPEGQYWWRKKLRAALERQDAVIDQALAAQRSKIVAALPEKRVMINMEQSPREQLGMTLEAAEAFNKAIDQVTQIINGTKE